MYVCVSVSECVCVCVCACVRACVCVCAQQLCSPPTTTNATSSHNKNNRPTCWIAYTLIVNLCSIAQTRANPHGSRDPCAHTHTSQIEYGSKDCIETFCAPCERVREGALMAAISCCCGGCGGGSGCCCGGRGYKHTRAHTRTRAHAQAATPRRSCVVWCTLQAHF